LIEGGIKERELSNMSMFEFNSKNSEIYPERKLREIVTYCRRRHCGDEI
jgi:hypothetical protein